MVTEDTGLPDGTDRPAGPVGFEPTEADRWRWRFSDEADVVVDAAAPLFDSQESAEDWLIDNAAGLMEQGVAAVALFDGEGAVYGPMPLAPPVQEAGRGADGDLR